MSLSTRMLVTAAAAVAVVLAAILVLATPGVRLRARTQTETMLLAEARLAARMVEATLGQGTNPEALDPMVDAAAREIQARVTIVAPDGRVLADSTASGSALLALENHADRPEVRSALRGEALTVTRFSATGRDELLYAAVPVRHQGRVVGAARVAQSTEAVRAQVSELWRAVALALALGAITAAVVAYLLSARLAASLREVMETARQFAVGNLSARIPARHSDEIGELGRILNQSADQLQGRLQEIARERGRQDAILAAMEDGVLAVDHRGTVILANQSLATSLDLHQPLGRHYVEVIRQREVGAVIEEVLRTADRRALEVEIVHLRRVFALTGVPFPGAEGAPPGAVLTFHDATERRRLDRIRRDFVANASHELRTPLTSIRGFVEALEDGAVGEPETAQRFLGKIRVHADRMASLVEDLLELSRLESGEHPPHWEEVSPADVVEDVVVSFTGLAGRKQVSLGRSDGGAPMVVTDADRLRRILENLVENAVKYTPAGGKVEVRSRPGPDRGAFLEVKDNGPGIAAEHLPRIFERFYRVDKARSRELGGTGLGLAIVRHLAEGMGASVSVESEPGRGTSFRVAVPAGREHST
jgi:two-component system, OmpR family, phosphate regulon sensor histidine kinase PhoR